MADELRARVESWLMKQGFPLEFRVAQTLGTLGFTVDQGVYVTDPKEGVLREIDVVASTDHVSRDHRLCFSLVAECKWSKEKPWIVFTSRHARPTLAASIAYVAGSSMAEAVLWLMAHDDVVQSAHRDAFPARFGFGGRQALAEKADKDLFYPAIQGVVASTFSLAHAVDRQDRSLVDIVRDIQFVMPVVVLEGRLFEAYMEREELKIEETQRVRLAWRGFTATSQPTFVDIVTEAALSKYAEEMFSYGEFLRYRAIAFAEKVSPGILKSDSRLMPSLPPSSTGVLVPHLLRQFVG